MCRCARARSNGRSKAMVEAVLWMFVLGTLVLIVFGAEDRSV
jgi:hypothetical protein